MAEATTYLFDYKEVAEALIKKQDIHEGFWGIGIEFGFGAQNVKTPKGYAPAAIIPVQKIGLNRWDEPNNMTVDAAQVNPAPATKLRREGGRRATKRAVKK
ncbi:MAG TPA: hypothetical protein VJ023_20055 [Pyrinomonadaceae bacterium]|nr:hypothetical protein [Pyrinomonadaceae bacterium]